MAVHVGAPRPLHVGTPWLQHVDRYTATNTQSVKVHAEHCITATSIWASNRSAVTGPLTCKVILALCGIVLCFWKNGHRHECACY